MAVGGSGGETVVWLRLGVLFWVLWGVGRLLFGCWVFGLVVWCGFGGR